MANDYFKFKKFTIQQGKCAMKVGTDGTLLGAWAQGGRHILDIGSGTGLVAMMMAQRFPEARIVGVEIDSDAALQARENVEASPFSSQIDVICADVRNYQNERLFDAIVSNPPYFDLSLKCPDKQRAMARHSLSLGYDDLMSVTNRLLTDNGILTVIVPLEYKGRMEAEAALTGFHKARECAVKTTPNKPPKRYLLAFSRHQTTNMKQQEGIIEISPGIRSDWYKSLTKDFYL